jgi:membrane associated rhomboid family serine protease
MGLADRQYKTRAPLRRSFGHPQAGSVTSWLIFLNVLVYVVDRWLGSRGYACVIWYGHGARVAYKPLEGLGHFSSFLAIGHWQVWRFITFQFLHANFDHLLFNMVTLYFFGPAVERYLTSRQFVPFYLLCGMGGAAMYFVLLAFGWRGSDPATELVGASAGIFGVLVAATKIAPDAVGLVLGIVPMRLRVLTWVFVAYAVFQVLFRGSNAGGEAAHLGGALIGFLLMTFPRVLERIAWLGKRAPPF